MSPKCPHCGEHVEPGDLEREETGFGTDPDEQQATLTEAASEGPVELPTLDDVVDWDSVDFDSLDRPADSLAFGQSYNDTDPSNW